MLIYTRILAVLISLMIGSVTLAQPLVWYKFDELSGSAINYGSLGSSANATVAGSVTQDQLGLLQDDGCAYQFDGGYVTPGTTSGLTSGTGSPWSKRSIELWFRADDTTGRQVIYEQGGGTRDLLVYLDGDTLYFSGNNRANDDGAGLAAPWGNGTPVHVSTSGIQPGAIYHVVAVLDANTTDLSGEMRLYLNGLLVASTTGAGPVWGMNPVCIGRTTNANRYHDNTTINNGNAFFGIIDDVKVWDEVLTADAIRQNYSEGYGLLAHYRFDETTGTVASDSSGNVNDGSYLGSPTLGVSAVRRTGAEFTSNDSYVYAPASPSLNMIGEADGDFTVAFWVKPNAYTGSWRPLFHKGDSNFTRGPGLWLRPSDNRIHYRLTTTHSWNEGGDTSGALEFDEWAHVILIKSASTLDFYINGKLDRSTNLIGESVGNTGGLYLGDSPWYGTTDSSMDDIRIYNKALSASEIANVYGLVGHWKLDETSGTTAYDSSGMGDDGTHNGGVAVNVAGSGTDELAIAAEYDGIDEETQLPSRKYDFSEGFATSMWVKPIQNLDNNYYSYFCLANGTYQDEIWVGWVNSGVGFQLYFSDTAGGSFLRTIEDNLGITADTWVHYVASVDGDGYATLYRDGVVTKTGFYTDLPKNLSRSSNLIANSVRGNEYLPAAMQDIRLYNRSLSDAEIEDLSGAEPTNGLRIMSWTEVANP